MANQRFYITTPIYYPSDRLHIGHAYCTTLADAIARYKRLAGYDVFFLTGSDEHGQKIQRKAQENGVSPKEYVDKIVDSFRLLWEKMSISYDDFIRTSEPRHHEVVQTIFQRIYDQGDIYKASYEGWYCTPCETFWLERQLSDMLGLKVQVKHSGKGGTVSLSYSSLDQLDMICQRLSGEPI